MSDTVIRNELQRHWMEQGRREAEREIAALKAENERMANAFKSMMRDTDTLMLRNAELKSERDAFKDMVHEDDAVAVQTLVQSVQDLKRSRDEWHDKCGDARSDAAQFKRERDEARALLRWVLEVCDSSNNFKQDDLMREPWPGTVEIARRIRAALGE